MNKVISLVDVEDLKNNPNSFILYSLQTMLTNNCFENTSTFLEERSPPCT